MAKGKSTIQTWYCSSCNRANYTSRYNKRSQKTPLKQKIKFCCYASCRKRVMHKSKDAK